MSRATAQATSAAAHLHGNDFGNGASVNICVTNSTKHKDGSGKSETREIAVALEDTEPKTQLVLWLESTRLLQIAGALAELGVTHPSDTLLLDEEDLEELGLKKIQMKKLQRAICELRSSEQAINQ